MTTPTDPSRSAAPSVREIAALTARLREITTSGRDVDPAERAQFLADKDALIARITATETDRSRAALRERYAAQDALTDAVRAGAEHPGYVLVGPSARTWLRDPDTGQPAAPVSEHEHRALRELLNREELDTTDPAWVTGPDGRDDVHSTVVPTRSPDTGDGWVLDEPPPGARVRDSEGDVWQAEQGGWFLSVRADENPGPHTADYLAQFAPLTALSPDPDMVDANGDDPAMPEWMREQARRTEAEIAAGTYVPGAPDSRERLVARLAELRADREPTDREPADREPTDRDVDDPAGSDSSGRDDPAWWALTGPDEAALTRGEVVEELTWRGFSAEQARSAVTAYLDETSDRIGVSVHQWAMDSHDVEAIAHTRPSVPVPEQRHASTGDLSPALGDEPPANAGERDECEAGRREQLVRWHTDDTTAGPERGERGDDVLVGPDDDDGEALIFEGRRW